MLVKMNEMKNQKGFTLIELMIVIAIIGILAAIAIPQFSAYRDRGYVASMKADCNAVRTAEEAYFVDNNTYLVVASTAAPTTLPGMKNLSAGNKVVVAASGTITTGFAATVTSSNVTSATAKIVFDSVTGQTVYTP